MGFVKGKPIKNVLYGIFHPLEMARQKPIMFMLMVGGGVYSLGVAAGWWPNILLDIVSKLKK